MFKKWLNTNIKISTSSNTSKLLGQTISKLKAIEGGHRLRQILTAFSRSSKRVWPNSWCTKKYSQVRGLNLAETFSHKNLWFFLATGWWFQPLWRILISWYYYSQYMEQKYVPNHQPGYYMHWLLIYAEISDANDMQDIARLWLLLNINIINGNITNSPLDLQNKTFWHTPYMHID